MVDSVDLLLLPVEAKFSVGVVGSSREVASKGHLLLGAGRLVNGRELCGRRGGGVETGAVEEGGILVVGDLDGSGRERK